MSGWTTAIMAIGTAVSAAGSYQQAKAAQAQANYQSQVAANNAIIAQQNAEVVRDRGKVAEGEQRDRIAQAKGAVKAGAAGAGFLVDDYGSTNVDLLADVAEAGELDMKRIQEATAMEERRALLQGQDFQAQSGLYALQASNISTVTAAGGTFLSGASSTASNYQKLTT